MTISRKKQHYSTVHLLPFLLDRVLSTLLKCWQPTFNSISISELVSYMDKNIKKTNNFCPISIAPSAHGTWEIGKKLWCVVGLIVLVTMATPRLSKLKSFCAVVICPAIPSNQFLFLKLRWLKSKSPKNTFIIQLKARKLLLRLFA